MDDFMSLAQLNDDERDKAYQKYKIIESYINNEQTLKLVSKHESIQFEHLGYGLKNIANKDWLG